MPTCWHCKAESDAEAYARVVHNHHDLHGPWAGWCVRGRDLIAPSGARLSPERLIGLAWRQDAEARAASARARRAARSEQQVRVVVVRLADYRQGGIAAA